jgi:hypothetical protein
MMIVRSDQEQQSAIGAFFPNLPLLFQPNRKVVNSVVARRFYGDNGNLCVCLLVDLGAQLFQMTAGFRRQNSRKVIHVARRLQIINVFGARD